MVVLLLRLYYTALTTHQYIPAYGWGGIPGPCGPPGIPIRGGIPGWPGPGLYPGLGGP